MISGRLQEAARHAQQFDLGRLPQPSPADFTFSASMLATTSFRRTVRSSAFRSLAQVGVAAVTSTNVAHTPF